MNGKAFKLNTRNGQSMSQSGGSGGETNELLQTQREVTVNEVFKMVRDASSQETARALQDSESPIAQDQKHMILGLVQKGWTKNEIVAENQRVWGQDVLILSNELDDNRSGFVRYGLPMVTGMLFLSPFLIRQVKVSQLSRMNKSHMKDELLRKIRKN